MVQIGGYLTILQYNDGVLGTQNVLKQVNLVNGVCCRQGSVKKNLKNTCVSKRIWQNDGTKKQKQLLQK